MTPWRAWAQFVVSPCQARSQVATIASYFEQQFEDARAAIVAELRSQVGNVLRCALSGRVRAMVVRIPQ